LELQEGQRSCFERIHDPECFWPQDPAAIEAFWKKAAVGIGTQRGPGK